MQYAAHSRSISAFTRVFDALCEYSGQAQPTTPDPLPRGPAGRLGRGVLGDSDALFLQQALQFPGLEHFADDVAAADELALDVKLRDRGPVRIGLDALTQI